MSEAELDEMLANHNLVDDPPAREILVERKPVRDKDGEQTGWRLDCGRVVTMQAVHFEKGVDGRDGYRLRGCTATGIGYTISVDTAHPEQAWELCKFLVSPEAQVIREDAGRHIGIHRIVGRRKE